MTMRMRVPLAAAILRTSGRLLPHFCIAYIIRQGPVQPPQNRTGAETSTDKLALKRRSCNKFPKSGHKGPSNIHILCHSPVLRAQCIYIYNIIPHKFVRVQRSQFSILRCSISSLVAWPQSMKRKDQRSIG